MGGKGGGFAESRWTLNNWLLRTTSDNFRTWRINNSFNRHLSLQFSVSVFQLSFLTRGSVATDWFWGWANVPDTPHSHLEDIFCSLTTSSSAWSSEICTHPSCTQLTPPVLQPRSAARHGHPVGVSPQERRKERELRPEALKDYILVCFLNFWRKCICYRNSKLYSRGNDWHGLKYTTFLFIASLCSSIVAQI